MRGRGRGGGMGIGALSFFCEGVMGSGECGRCLLVFEASAGVLCVVLYILECI